MMSYTLSLTLNNDFLVLYFFSTITDIPLLVTLCRCIFMKKNSQNPINQNSLLQIEFKMWVYRIEGYVEDVHFAYITCFSV